MNCHSDRNCLTRIEMTQLRRQRIGRDSTYALSLLEILHLVAASAGSCWIISSTMRPSDPFGAVLPGGVQGALILLSLAPLGLGLIAPSLIVIHLLTNEWSVARGYCEWLAITLVALLNVIYLYNPTPSWPYTVVLEHTYVASAVFSLGYGFVRLARFTRTPTARSWRQVLGWSCSVLVGVCYLGERLLDALEDL